MENKMKNDCRECSGSGKVDVSNYREQESKPMTEKKPKKSWPWKKLFTGACAIPAVYYACIGLVCLSKSCEENNKTYNYEQNKNGEILVEYNNDGTPTRCIVQNGNTYVTNNSTRKIFISNRHDDQHITEVSNFLGWDEAKGKCYRFDYIFDHK